MISRPSEAFKAWNRRALEKRMHEEAQLEGELEQCPFAPTLRGYSPDSRRPFNRTR